MEQKLCVDAAICLNRLLKMLVHPIENPTQFSDGVRLGPNRLSCDSSLKFRPEKNYAKHWKLPTEDTSFRGSKCRPARPNRDCNPARQANREHIAK